MKQSTQIRPSARLHALDGQDGIYREGELIKHVRIAQLKIDDGMLTLLHEPLSTPGFTSRADAPFQIDAKAVTLMLDAPVCASR